MKKVFVICASVFTLAVVACQSGSSTQQIVAEASRLAQNNKIDQAIALYQKAIYSNDLEPLYYINQAKLFRESNNYDHALQNYTVLERHFPKSEWPYIGRAKLELKQNKVVQAYQTLLRGAKVAENTSGIYFYLGMIDFKAGRGEYALQNLNKSLDNQFIDQAVIYYYRGLTQLNLLKNSGAAKLDFQSYLATGDNRFQDVVKTKLAQI